MGDKERTDEELLQAVRAQGDRRALETLLERHEPEIWRFGMRMCRDPEDAKDVLQETLLAAARTAREFRGSSSVATWLFAIARSFCIKKRRRSKFAPDALLSLEQSGDARGIASPEPQPDDAAASRELATALEQAIAALEPAQREVLLLRDVEGLTAPEVGEVLGLGVEAVKSRLHRARAVVRERLSPLLATPGVAAAAPWDCPDIVAVFSRYLEGEIGPGECARMQQHVDACPRCRASCDALKQTLAICHAKGRAGTVPPEVQALVRKALRDLAATGA